MKLKKLLIQNLWKKLKIINKVKIFIISGTCLHMSQGKKNLKLKINIKSKI